MAKRPIDSLVVVQDAKRTKQDLVGYTLKDKALLEAVSTSLSTLVNNTTKPIIS